MSRLARLPPWFRLMLVLLALLAVLRGLAVVAHRPLLAFANNFDQIRYTTCVDLAPWRPGVPAERAHPQAPLSRYAFQSSPVACVLTSDLLFTAPLALAWKMSEALGARAIHSVRRLGELRLLAWWLVALWATRELLRADRPDVALAHLAWFALVGMDPANVLYFSTFYAEAAALFGFYLCSAGTLVALFRPTRTALALTALGALLLASAKFQHLLLPLLLGVAVLATADRAGRRVAFALLLGGTLGCAMQIGDALRPTQVARDIATVNRADFVLTILLPETDHRAQVVAALQLEEACVAYSGKSVYVMPQPVEQICSHVNAWPRLLPWALLLRDPAALARALLHVPSHLLPWLPADELGVVEGANYALLPQTVPTLSTALGARRSVAAALLLLPWLVFGIASVRRAACATRAFALFCAVGAASVALVALFGDGDVEYAKHAQLTVAFALASLGVPFAAAVRRGITRRSA